MCIKLIRNWYYTQRSFPSYTRFLLMSVGEDAVSRAGNIKSGGLAQYLTCVRGVGGPDVEGPGLGATEHRTSPVA